MITRVLDSKESAEPDYINVDYLTGGVAVLAAKPLPRYEQLIAKVMDSRDDSHGYVLKLAGAKALARFGGRDALPALERSRKWFSRWAGDKRDRQFILTKVDEAMAAVRARIKSSHTVDSTDRRELNSVPTGSRFNIQVSEKDPRLTISFWFGCVFLLVVIICGWWYLRWRGRKQ